MVRPLNIKDSDLAGSRKAVAAFVENRNFTRFITTLIVINAVTLGLETYDELMKGYGILFHGFNLFVLKIFVLELLLKLYAYRGSFFRVGWNVFDFVIVGVSVLPLGEGLAILRSLRTLRILRLISVVPQMRSVIGALFHAIPGMASIIGVLFVLLYVAAVMATQIFGQHPDPLLQEYFGTVNDSMYTMFQLMTLEDWPDIANPTMVHFPWAWTFFIPFIIITTFAVLNLFIGIIVDALHIVKEGDLKKEEYVIRDDLGDIKDMIHGMQSDLDSLRRHLDK